MDIGICWGVLRPRALSTQPYDRHSEQVTPGHHWHMSRRLGSETGLRPGILRWTPTLRAQMRQRDTLAQQDTLAHEDTLAYHTDTLAHKGLDNDVTNTSSPSRAGRGIVALLRGFLAGLGRPWVREPGKTEDKSLNIHNVHFIFCLSELWPPITVPKTVG